MLWRKVYACLHALKELARIEKDEKPLMDRYQCTWYNPRGITRIYDGLYEDTLCQT